MGYRVVEKYCSYCQFIQRNISTLATELDVNIFNDVFPFRELMCIFSRSRWQRISQIAKATLFAATLLATQSCKDDELTNPAKTLQLSGPSVFLPVGILRGPEGITTDRNSNIWVADTRNNRIRKFRPSGTQVDSSLSITHPTKIAIHRTNGDLLVVEAGTAIARYDTITHGIVTRVALIPFSGDASAVLDVTTGNIVPRTISLAALGDIDSSPLDGNVFVSGRGTPENIVVRIVSGTPFAIASSSTVPSNSTDQNVRFIASDSFGTLFTSFTFLGTSGQNVVRGYWLNPSNLTQNKILTEPVFTGSAQGGTIDAASYLFIADSAAQELVVISVLSEKTILRYRIPDTNGFSMCPRDVAVALDGSVYVIVTDRLGTDAGAVLRYVKTTQ